MNGGGSNGVPGRGRGLWPALLPALCLAWCVTATGGERMALMPVRDLTGDPVSAEVLQQALHEELSGAFELVDSGRLRDVLRRWRIRDVRSVPPSRLLRMADETGVDWIFTATLHRCHLEPMPMVTVSVQVMRRGRPRLAWAGFCAVTAMDEVRLLGRGWLGDLDLLERKAAARLAREFGERGGDGERPPRPAERVYRRGPLDIASTGAVAVLPFAGATGVGATNAALMATDLACAVLWRRGADLALPGAVDDLLRRDEVAFRGGLDGPTRERLVERLDVDLLFTGTVETFEFVRQGTEPEPAAALSVRLIEADTGRLLAHGGAEREGWDRQRLFGRNRVYSPERLAELIMESLVADLGEKGGYGPSGGTR